VVAAAVNVAVAVAIKVVVVAIKAVAVVVSIVVVVVAAVVVVVARSLSSSQFFVAFAFLLMSLIRYPTESDESLVSDPLSDLLDTFD